MSLTTLQEVKDWLGITDGSHDTTLGIINSAMNDAIINYCETDFQKHENVTEILDGNKSDMICPRETPILSVSEIRFWVEPDGSNGELIDPLLYQVLPEAIIIKNLPTPRYRSMIKVVYDWGYESVPSDVKLCALQAVEAEFRRKGKKTLGGGSRSKKDESETINTDSASWDIKTGLPMALASKLNVYKRFEFPAQPMAQRNW